MHAVERCRRHKHASGLLRLVQQASHGFTNKGGEGREPRAYKQLKRTAERQAAQHRWADGGGKHEQGGPKLACMQLKRTKWCSFLFLTTERNMRKKMMSGENWLLK
jgi:hypothetical protein